MVNWITENPNKKDFNDDAFGLDIVNDTPGDTDSALEYWFPNINNAAYLEETYDKIGIEKEKPKSKGVGKYNLPDISTETTGDTFDSFMKNKLEEYRLKNTKPSSRQPGLNIANDGDEVITEDTITIKDRMSNIFNDADKRDAILGGIADAMLETRTGADAYGNRFNRAQKNVRDNLKIAEATDIARQKAQLDAMKTMAETNKLMDPRQYLTNAQREAESFVRAQIRAGKVKPEDFNTAYASMLKQIAVKDLTSAKASSIGTLFTYAQALQQSDPDTAKILMDAIRSNANYLAGDSSGEASGEVVIDATEFKK